MLQSLDVISVNLWNILIACANLTILFFGVKKFLFQPIKNILKKRQDEIDVRYMEAEKAEQEAFANKDSWEKKMQKAEDEANSILLDATEHAKSRGDKIVSEAKAVAEGIIRQAEFEAELEHKKAVDEIKREIVEVSGAIAEKMLEREIDTENHRNLIDSFIEKIGEDNDGAR